MRFTILTAGIICLFACHQQESNIGLLQHQIDSLRNRIDSAYAPGLGEFMLSIQMHHAKLWFAGKNGNWKLADFEMEEIREGLDDIQKYNQGRPEIRDLPMINSPLDSIQSAIAGKNTVAFKSGFNLLTKTCNNCHQVTKHGFNVIRIPDIPPVSNQVF